MIAVVEGKMPSEVAQKTYEMKDYLRPVLVEREDNIRRADKLTHQDTGINVDDLNFHSKILASGGSGR